jgi:hypothetical protein
MFLDVQEEHPETDTSGFNWLVAIFAAKNNT